MAWNTSSSRSRLLSSLGFASVLFVAMTVVKTYPLIVVWHDHIAVELGDPLLNAWILSWGFHALTSNPGSLFDANIFYPVQHSLAFSEHMLGVQPLFAPIYAFTANPILAYNIVYFLSFPLCGVAMFVLVHYWTRSFWASFLAGSLFAFAPTRLLQIGHLQLLNFYWAPLALFGLEQFLRSQRWKYLAGFAICYWWQVLCSVYLGWLITILAIIYTGYYLVAVDRQVLTRGMLVKGVTFGALTSLVLIPVHLPYYVVKQQWGFSRSRAECIVFSADLVLSYVNPFPFMHDLYLAALRFATQLSSPGENYLFPGLVLPGLMLLSLMLPRRLPAPPNLPYIRSQCWLIVLTSFMLSLGPHLVILGWDTQIPLPYLVLYHLVPGFQAMRVPTRFVLMGGVAASVLAGIGFLGVWAALQARLKLRRLAAGGAQACLTLSILGLFGLELGFTPLPLARVQTGHEVPEVYRWLAKTNLGPIVELPIGMAENFVYMHFSTYHWLPLVNGWSGFGPPVYMQLARKVDSLPSRQAVDVLSAVGVRALVVHHDRLPPAEDLRWRQEDFATNGLEPIAAFGADVIYKLPTVDVTPRVVLKFGAPTQLPAGTALSLAMLGAGEGRQTWMHPPPLGRTVARVDWMEVSSGTRFIQRQTLEFPIVIRAGEFSTIALPVSTPAAPGAYELRVTVPSLSVEIPPTPVSLATDPLPTSLNAPQLLAADYTLDASVAHTVVSMPMRLALRATNTGKAVWLANAAGDKGSVRLGWRWFKGGREIPGTAGRQPLPYAIFPEQTYAFHASIDAPSEPGDYLLDLGLVSELVTWFSVQGSEPLRISVRVEERPAGGLSLGR